MIPFQEFRQNITRRHFFQQGSHALGWAALSSLMGNGGEASGAESPPLAPQIPAECPLEPEARPTCRRESLERRWTGMGRFVSTAKL